MPKSPFKNALLKILGFKIKGQAKIGPNLLINLKHVHIGENAVIRPFNVFRNIKLELGDNAIVGSWNWIGSAKGLEKSPNYLGLFKLGEHSSINSRNYFDVSGGVIFGNFTDLAGVRSTFITHQIDTANSKQTCNLIRIGNHSMICSNSIIVPGGTLIGDRTVVAMGSVVTSGKYDSDSLYAGVPAKLKKSTSGEWFIRKEGSVSG
jgi:acetyltransferase-like isoleucine patch superfamily enzyme